MTDPTGFVAAGKATGAEKRQCGQDLGCRIAEDGSLEYFGYDSDGNWVQTGSSNEQGSSNSTDTKNTQTKQNVVAPTLNGENVKDYYSGWISGIPEGISNTVTGTLDLFYDLMTFKEDLNSLFRLNQRYLTFGPSLQDMARNYHAANRMGDWKTGGNIHGQATGAEVVGLATTVVGGRLLGSGNKVVINKIPLINGRRPINYRYAGKVHPDGVKFTEQGFPDFSPYQKARVKIEGLTGDYGYDSALANKAMNLKKTPTNYVWHHVEDGKTMQLIPQAIHDSVKHTGGAAIIRNGGFDK